MPRKKGTNPTTRAKTDQTERSGPRPQVTVALGLGSNVGSLEDNLISAIRELERSLESLAVAPPYRSQPAAHGSPPTSFCL